MPDAETDNSTEAALRTARDRYDTMLRAIPDLLFEIDGEDRLIDFRAEHQPALLDPNACLGKRFDEFLPPNTWEPIRAALAEARRTGTSFGQAYSLVLGGEERWYEISVAREQATDRPAACIVLARDITARRRAKDEVRKLNAQLEARVQERTARLEAINRELESFTHSVSHDLKGPLRSVDGYCQLLRDKCAPLLDDDGRRMFDQVKRSVQEMHDLINGLLAYSLIERDTLQSDVIVLRDLVQQALNSHSGDLSAHGVRVIVNPSEAEVVTDLNALMIALRNLIDNAIKFCRASAQPTIEITFDDQPTHVTVAIRDNGVGFDMRFHDRIYEVFQRLHRDATYPGTGIGLAMVRKAMNRIGGRVWAESQPGAGATFFLEVPKTLEPGVP